jgi:hypothetical protein
VCLIVYDQKPQRGGQGLIWAVEPLDGWTDGWMDGLTDQSCMNEQIKNTLHSGNACYHSVQSLLSSRLLSRNVKVKIYKTIILPVVLYGCETWSLTLR